MIGTIVSLFDGTTMHAFPKTADFRKWVHSSEQ